MRRLGFELAAMVLIVVLAGISVVATLGSARSGDLVFCRMVDGGIVVGATTDCSDVIEVVDVTDVTEMTDGVPIAAPSSSSPATAFGAPFRLVSPSGVPLPSGDARDTG